MKITPKFSFLTLLIYIGFSYFFWIDRNFNFAGVILLVFLLISMMVHSLKGGIPLIFVVSLAHLILWGVRYTYYLQWPLDFYVVALLGFAFLRFILRHKLSKGLNWSVKFTRNQWTSIIVINVPAIFILAWYFSSHKEIAQQWPFPNLPFWAIPFVIILLATINGLREEIFYRGLLQSLSEERFPGWFVVSLQAVLFGALHFTNAFPQGWVGVALTAAWGAAIAIQYHVFRSITLSWLTHSVADAVMFTIILANR